MNKRLTKGGKQKLIFKPLLSDTTPIINTLPGPITPIHTPSSFTKPTPSTDISINLSQFKPMHFSNENEPQLIKFLEKSFDSDTEILIEIDDLTNKYTKIGSEVLIVEDRNDSWREIGLVRQMWVAE